MSTVATASPTTVRLSRSITERLPKFASDVGLLSPASVVIGAWAIIVARCGGRRGATFAIDAEHGRRRFSAEIVDGMSTARWLRDVETAWQQAPPATASDNDEADDARGLQDTLVHLHAAVDASTAPVAVIVEDGPPFAVRVELAAEADDVARRGAGLLELALERILRDAEVSPAALRLVTDLEAVQIAAWNDTARSGPMPLVTELVLQQAAAAPDAIATVHGSERLTYAQLVARASQLAHYLRGLGVGADDIVGVMLSRTAEAPAALLGVLLAGAGYVALDHAYPAERVRFMLEDSGARVVVTNGADGAALLGEAVPIVDLRRHADAIARCPGTPPELAIDRAQVAYMIYTSGSTGRPKGVLVEHGNLAAFLAAVCPSFSAEELGKAGACASLCFDFSVFEIFAPLSTGGTVAVFKNALELGDASWAEGLSMVSSVPTAIEALFRADQAPRGVKTVNFGGEVLTTELVDRVMKTGVTRVGNVYGPTECTVYATVDFFDCESLASRQWSDPPIGRPIANTKLWVLDDFGQPAPPGVAGELFIGGLGVGRGYHRRPALTAERFVPDPFSGLSGARLYRTGDTVRWRPDGTLEFVGRRDHQVKVRGYRIELPEIEAALVSHPAVREAAVVVTGRSAVDRALLAYVGTSGRALDEGELRAFLGDRLPRFMVPNAVVVLDALPRLPNGKLDRKALLDEQPARSSHAEHVAPRTPTEQTLAAIWAEVLHVDEVGVNDDFFELGGQSLLALQVIARVRDAFGGEIPLAVVFEKRTLGAVAAEIDAGAGRNRIPPVVRRGKTTGPVSGNQRSLVGAQREQEGLRVTPTSGFMYRLSGDLDVAALEQALNEVVRRHESLRTTFPKVRGRHRQVVQPFAYRPLGAGEQRSKSRDGNALRARLTDTVTEPFDLEHGPLVRWELHPQGKREHVLLVAAHEIVADGWSFDRFKAELSTLYEDFTAGRPPSLPEPPLQYLDFAAWERKLLKRVGREQLRYWKQTLAGVPLGLQFFPDLARTEQGTVVPNNKSWTMGKAETEAVRSMARAHGATLYTALLAAYKALIFRATGSVDIGIDAVLANRKSAALEDVIGFFSNHALLRTSVAGDPTFDTLMHRVREAFLHAVANIDIPSTDVNKKIFAMRTARALWPFRERLRFQLLGFPDQQELTLGNVKVLPGPPLGTGSGEHLFLRGSELADGGVLFELRFDASRYQPSTVDRIVGDYREILRAVTEDSSLRVSALPRTGRSGGKGRGGKQASSLPSTSVVDLLAQQAQRNPRGIAVARGDVTLTFGQLDERARALSQSIAAALGPAHAAAETPVAIVAAPGPAMVVAMLAAWRAGAMCVPVDPSLSASVIGAILDHAAPVVVVADRPVSWRGPVLTVSEDDVPVGSNGAAASVVGGAVMPDGAALAMYSFGAGEAPKAAVLTHSALAGVAAGHRDAHRLRPDDRCAELPRPRLGRMPWAVWGPLVGGAAYVVADDGVDGVEWMSENGITVCVGDRAVVSARAEAEGGGAVGRRDPLRLIVADEPCLFEGAVAPKRAKVVEVLGWPEMGGDGFLCDRPRSAASPFAVGSTVSGVDAVVLDATGHLAEPGMIGEICTDCSTMGLGYFRDPRRTADTFVPHPASDGGARLFRTGLVGRLGPRGLEILGRRDDLTWRGGPTLMYLRQIEAALGAHPAVATVVAFMEDVMGDPRVTVAATARIGMRLRTGELKAMLPDGLPDSARPWRIETKKELPRRTDGSLWLTGLVDKPKRRRR